MLISGYDLCRQASRRQLQAAAAIARTWGESFCMRQSSRLRLQSSPPAACLHLSNGVMIVTARHSLYIRLDGYQPTARTALPQIRAQANRPAGHRAPQPVNPNAESAHEKATRPHDSTSPAPEPKSMLCVQNAYWSSSPGSNECAQRLTDVIRRNNMKAASYHWANHERRLRRAL